MPMGGSATINVSVVAPNYGATLASTANVSTAVGYEERSYTNNSSSLSTTVRPRPATAIMNPTSLELRQRRHRLHQHSFVYRDQHG